MAEGVTLNGNWSIQQYIDKKVLIERKMEVQQELICQEWQVYFYQGTGVEPRSATLFPTVNRLLIFALI